MKEKVRLWLVGIATAVVAISMTTAVVLANAPRHEECRFLEIDIEDEDLRHYVDAQELVALLRSKGLDPIGMETALVPAGQIERAVREHPMVRRAECYMTTDHCCRIRLTQRIPAYRVVTPGESYLIDTDRKPMPIRSGMDLNVMTANGAIGKRMATEELYDMMMWLDGDRYWKEQLSRAEVVSPDRVQLVRKDGKQIVLGEMTDFRAKLDKFRTVDRKAFAEIGMPENCREIDLRFAGQVVTR